MCRLLCVLLSVFFVAQVSANSFAIFRDAQGVASLSLVNDEGVITKNSSLHFTFPFPLVETTVDQAHRRIYIIAFPKNVAGAQLYILDEQLNVVFSGVSQTVTYFDLQYSPGQDAIYGIAVNGTYGRVLSNFTLNSTVTYRPLQALPYMWYVNASTYDSKTNTYYGLLNYFPGHPNSTLAQKLAVGNFSSPRANTEFVDLTVGSAAYNVTVHFIVWSSPAQTLYGLAQLDTTTVALVIIDPITGLCVAVGLVRDATTGPLIASPTEPVLYAWIHTTTGARVFGRFDLTLFEFEPLEAYTDGSITAAAAPVTW
eukprot:m.238799 g.238799  ORF g.238799 m.238799 type:complete len:312 (+) comp22035_c0_seq1:76-1011(+)